MDDDKMAALRMARDVKNALDIVADKLVDAVEQVCAVL